MQPFTSHIGKPVALPHENIDTDQIIPKQFLKRIERTGYGKYLFFDSRYLQADGAPNPEFELNKPQFAGASVLVAGPNFGCGSSREHAVWALMEYGIRAVIAPSFADIFSTNAYKNGLLTATVTAEVSAQLLTGVRRGSITKIDVDLLRQQITAGNLVASFSIDDFRRDYLLRGLDDIAQTLTMVEEISTFEEKRPKWLEHGSAREAIA